MIQRTGQAKTSNYGKRLAWKRKPPSRINAPMKAPKKYWRKQEFQGKYLVLLLLLLILAQCWTAFAQTPKRKAHRVAAVPLEQFYDPEDTVRIVLVEKNQAERLLEKIRQGEAIRKRYAEHLALGDSLMSENNALENDIAAFQARGEQQQRAVEDYQKRAEDMDVSARALRRKLRREKKKSKTKKFLLKVK